MMLGMKPKIRDLSGYRPEIINVLEARYTGDRGAVFQFTADTVRGKAPRFPFGWAALACLVIFIAGVELMEKHQEHETLIMAVFFWAGLALPVCVVGFIAGKLVSRGPRWFELKFGPDGPEWSCGDPAFWAPVREKLELASRGELAAPEPETPEAVLQRLAGLAFTAGGLQLANGLGLGGEAAWIGGVSLALALAFAARKSPQIARALFIWSLAAAAFSVQQRRLGLGDLGAWTWFLPFVAAYSWHLTHRNSISK
jgi:hypothetical protein